MPMPQPDLAPVHGERIDLPAARVILFGELLADCFPDRRVAGGAPFNVACHLQRLGSSPLLATRVGRDSGSAFLLEAMQRTGLSTALLQFDPQHGSGQVEVIAEGDSHRFEIAPDQAFDYIDPEALAAAVAGLGDDGRPQLIYFGTLAQRSARSRAALAALLERCAVPRFVDLNLRPPWVRRAVCEDSLREARCVKMSEVELRTVGAWLGDVGAAASDEQLARRVVEHFGIARLFVTCGENGAWCLAGGALTRVASPPPPAGGDAVGAGDAFSAVLIVGTLADWPLALTLERAARFASAVCGIRGATPASADFYRPFLDDWSCR